MSQDNIDSPVVLEETTIEFILSDSSIVAPAKAILQLSPRPRVIIEFDLPPGSHREHNEINSTEFTDIRLSNGTVLRTVIGGIWRLSSDGVSNILVPIDQPVTVINANSKIRKCKFSLINFPSMWGDQDIHYEKKINGRTQGYVTQHLHFTVDSWSIDITAIDRLMAIDLKMRHSGGSIVTHHGSLTKIRDQEFSLSELEHTLHFLHLFLSFARGSYCGLTLLSGEDVTGRTTWQQWGTYRAEPWLRTLPTWVCGLNSEMLVPIVGGLWKKYCETSWRDTINRSLRWYLRSNESTEIEVGIVLTQAALECLSHACVGSRSGVRQGEWIGNALHSVGITTEIPEQCKDLAKVQKRRGWEHGPHALVDIRNNLIHSDTRAAVISRDAYRQAWDLGQWYVELMLLQISGYSGRYLNRLKRGHGYVEAVEDVPWA